MASVIIQESNFKGLPHTDPTNIVALVIKMMDGFPTNEESIGKCVGEILSRHTVHGNPINYSDEFRAELTNLILNAIKEEPSKLSKEQIAELISATVVRMGGYRHVARVVYNALKIEITIRQTRGDNFYVSDKQMDELVVAILRTLELTQ